MSVALQSQMNELFSFFFQLHYISCLGQDTYEHEATKQEEGKEN